MTKIKKFRTLEECILRLQQEAKSMPVSIKEVLHILSGKGRPLVLILLSLPFCLPIQIPGLSTPFGLVIAFIGLRMSFGKRLWLPKNLSSKKITAHSLENITNKALWIARKIKHWIYPRFVWLCQSPIMKTLHGLAFFLLGIFLALPLPIPFSNLVAAWSIFLIALGIVEDDGLLIIAGYIIAVLGLLGLILIILSVKNFF